MHYLAVKNKDNEYLFTQSRVERETQNSVLIDEGKKIETIVVRVFDTESEAINYCVDINGITGILNHLF